MKTSLAEKVLYALLYSDMGLTRQDLQDQLGLPDFHKVMKSARAKARALGAVIPRPVYPHYRYVLVDKDNPDVPAYKAGVGAAIKELIAKFLTVQEDAETVLQIVDKRTREGKFVRILEMHARHTNEQIAVAREELLGAS